MSTRRGSSQRKSSPAESSAENESVTTSKKGQKKEKVNKGDESPDRVEKGSKQAKINEMIEKMPKENVKETDTEMKLRALIEVVTRLEGKVNELASKEYIDKALDERLEGIVSEDFVNTSIEKLKKDISDQMKSDFDKVYDQLRCVKSKLKETESETEHLKNENSDRQLEIQKVREENETLKKKNKELTEKVYNNNDRILYNEFMMNELEQYTRKNSIRIYGMNDTNKDENATQTGESVIKLLKDHLEIDIKPGDIDIAHRLGKFSSEGNRPVVCKFVYRTTKQEVMNRRKRLKGKTYVIREDLTSKNAKLLEKLSAKDEVKNCWSDGGKIIALLTNDKKVRVDSYTDLTRSLLRA